MTRRLILLLASISILSGCGFALRGNVNLSEALSTVTISGADPAITERLEDALSHNGATTVADDDDSATKIAFNQSEYKREVRTTDDSGLTTSYTLRYLIGYDVISSEGETLQGEQRLTQTKSFSYDPTQQLQADEEEEFLREEMEKEIVQQILRRLSRI